jgi:hypothetical protein
LSTGWWVYGAAAASSGPNGHFQGITGLFDQGVELIGGGPMRLVASRVDPDAAAGLEQAERGRLVATVRCHDAVLTAVSRRTTVVPIRFGTVLPDAAAVEQLLQQRKQQLQQLLHRVDGADEWVVSIGAATEQAEDVSADVANQSRGHAYFARKRAEARQRERRREQAGHAADLLDDALRPLIRARAPLGSSAGSGVERVAYLVGRAQAEAFVTIAESSESAISVSGPLPPYRFAESAA